MQNASGYQMIKEYWIFLVGRDEIKKTRFFLIIAAVQWLLILTLSYAEYEALVDRLAIAASDLLSSIVHFLLVIALVLNLVFPLFLLIVAIIGLPFFIRKKRKNS